MNAFAWLNDLMLWLGKWFPRLTLVKATEAGVLFGRSGSVREVGPGLCFYWPLVSILRLCPTTRRTQEICAQLVGDETISLAVFWRIANVRLALTMLTDITGNLDDYSQAALSHACSAAGGKLSNDALRFAVQTRLGGQLRDVGLEIMDIGIVHRGSPVPIKLINDWATHEDANRG